MPKLRWSMRGISRASTHSCWWEGESLQEEGTGDGVGYSFLNFDAYSVV